MKQPATQRNATQTQPLHQHREIPQNPSSDNKNQNLIAIIKNSPQTAKQIQLDDKINSSPTQLARYGLVNSIKNSKHSTEQLNKSNKIAPDNKNNFQNIKSTQAIQRFPVTEEARGTAHRIRGGTSMTAKVGASSQWVYGSQPPGGVPNLMDKVGVSIQGKKRYVAGHLLNDNMGGLGVNNNLTVLSVSANASHRGIEGRIKRLAEKSDSINRGSNAHGNPNYDHGVRYSVRVLDPNPTGPFPFANHEQYISSGLEIDITPIRIHKTTHVESPWPEQVGEKLTNHSIKNVPPYPAVPKKKKLTPIQKKIFTAISAMDGSGATANQISEYIISNETSPPKKGRILAALSQGVSSKFFSKRNGVFKVIQKNIQL